MKPNMKQMVFILLIILVGLIGVLHTITPGYMILYHDTYRRLSYFPITIGAILYGVWGGVSIAVLSCLSFVPHLYLFWAREPQAYYSELSEILFYLAAGVVIGLISSRENRLREKYKNLSEKLAASYQRLHSQTSVLVEAEKQLGESRKLSMLGHVSASLAHEIKNPLASIKGATEILADEVPKAHPKHEFIEIMRDEVSRLNHSVEEVLQYCRGQQHSGKDSVQPAGGGQREDVGKIIHRVVMLLETNIGQKNIEVSVDVHGSGHPKVDGPAMTQVLTNIIINAIDAVDKNGRVQISLRPDKSGCSIHVYDDGPGILLEHPDDVFHSFVTGKDGGTGLGLSISRRIIESLGGKLFIEASPLGGAGFVIYLPENQFITHGRISNA